MLSALQIRDSARKGAVTYLATLIENENVGEYVGFDTEQDIRLAGILPVDSDREQLGPITTNLIHRCGALLRGILLKAIKSEKYW